MEKMATIERLTKKIFHKNRRGGGVHQPPPVPARVKVITGHQRQNFPKFPNDMTWLHIIRTISVPIRATTKF